MADINAVLNEIGARLRKTERLIKSGTSPIVSVATAQTLKAANQVALVNAAGGAITVTLPLVANSRYAIITIKKTDSSANQVTIDGNGAETIDGAANFVLIAQYDAVTLWCSGSAWLIVSNGHGGTSASGFVPLAAPLTSTAWDGDAYSTTGKTLIDLSAVFGAPALIKAVLVRVRLNDSASSGVLVFRGIILAPNSTNAEGIRFSVNSHANDAVVEGTGTIPCDANGDIYYQTSATGAGTLDILLEIWGYWV